MRDWDAATYTRVAEAHLDWASAVLDRLALRGDETVLDAGCGAGHVTELLVRRLPRGRVIAVDAAPSMVEAARQRLGDGVAVFRADLNELALQERVDAVFSSAVFHWIKDHARLFERLRGVLRPGGRLVSQCGGEGNIESFRQAAMAVARAAPYASHFGEWRGPWHFAGVDETERRLVDAGLVPEFVSLVPWPVQPADAESYVRTVCLGHHLERLPENLHDRFVSDVLDRCDMPLVLDYVRLNIDARRPA